MPTQQVTGGLMIRDCPMNLIMWYACGEIKCISYLTSYTNEC